MPTLFPGLDNEGDADIVVGEERVRSLSSKPSRPSLERARRQRRRREALEQQQKQLLQSISTMSLPLVAGSADLLRTAIQHLFGAELLERAAEQQCQRNNYGQGQGQGSSSSSTTLCEAAAVSIYDKEADFYTRQAVGWLVSVPTKPDVDAMAAKLNQVATVQAMGTVYAVRIHVDSCDATYVQYDSRDDGLTSASATSPNDDNNHSMVLRDVDDISDHRSNGIVKRHFRSIVQFWSRLQGTFRQLRQRCGKRRQQQQQQQKQKREPKDKKQEQQEQLQQSQSRTLTNTTTVLRSPSVWLAAARTLVPGRDRFQCLIRTESSVQMQAPYQGSVG
jgi:hypothetical protein